MGEQHDRLFSVVDDIVGQARLVVQEERDAIGRGDVARGHDGELVPGKAALEADAANASTRNGTPDGDAVQEARHCQIVHVARLAGDFRAAFFAWNGATHHRSGHGSDPTAIYVRACNRSAVMRACSSAAT